MTRFLALTLAFVAAITAETRAEGPVPGEAWKLPLPDRSRLELRWIPPGTFTMGSPATEPGRRADEGPQTQVTLTRGFWLGRTLVTVGQWKQVMGLDLRAQLKKRIRDDTLWELGGKQQRLRDLMHWSLDADPVTYLANEDDDLPMYFVSWNDAMEFAAKLTAQERTAGRLPDGYEFNLPTEAQWEYACRAGTTTPTYAGTNEPAVLSQLAWFDQNSAEGYAGRRIGPTKSGPRVVGLKEANGWGLHDMYGNIWQWCRDWYGPYVGGSVTDPTGPATGTGRVNRGGSFGSGINSLRSATRASNPQPEASAYRGFRIALVPVVAPPNPPRPVGHPSS
ncbi:MAG TPA: SUMF1/EgtB/PvdO family nonheme iron enzyme [Lacunisphaera sp.]|nr:SUMF1/EgtB/PvdO family nonheme iron enzyme [Lacunisphaera sp.]